MNIMQTSDAVVLPQKKLPALHLLTSGSAQVTRKALSLFLHPPPLPDVTYHMPHLLRKSASSLPSLQHNPGYCSLKTHTSQNTDTCAHQSGDV